MRACNSKWPVTFLLLLSAACVSEERPVSIEPVAQASSEKAAEFTSAGERFRSPNNCVAHLQRLVTALPGAGYEVARGPYPVVEGDTRIHGVRGEADGHVVLEYRCLSNKLEARSWKIPARG